MDTFLADPQIEILKKFLIALFLGALIGFEREAKRKPAGLRTHMLVVGASCLLVSINDLMVEAAKLDASGALRTDPLRTIHALVTGIAFLGAGTIIRHRDTDRVEGLTTAATILLGTVVGIYVGLSKYIVAFGVSLLAVFVVHTLRSISHKTPAKNESS